MLRDYARYADSQVGRWQVKEDGHRDPSVRTLMKPILNLFHGEPGSKKWKNAVDGILKDNPSTLSEVLDRSLHLLSDEVLDAPPRQLTTPLPKVGVWRHRAAAGGREG